MRTAKAFWTVGSAGFLIAACDAVLIAQAYAGPAIGQFDVKSLEIEPGEIEMQIQSPYSFNVPRRRTAIDGNGDFVGDHNTISKSRQSIDLEYGITRYLKAQIGVEYESERTEEFATLREAEGFSGTQLDEYAAEVIWVPIPRNGDGAGLGILVEYEIPAEKGGAQTLIAGPIFEWASGSWQFTAIPMLIKYFGGERNDAGQLDEKIDFSYSSHIKYQWSDSVELALEAFGTIERVGGKGGPSDEAAVFGNFDQHRIGPVAYYTFKLADSAGPGQSHNDDDESAEVRIGAGALFGLNKDTPSTTLKLNLEVSY